MEEKYRHELKYVVDDRDMVLIRERLSDICSLDRNTGADGGYLIRSVYFDDYNNTFYWENENGEDIRYKYRIRIYNTSDKAISLEKKSKKSGMTLKKSVRITRSMADCLISEAGKGNGGPPDISEGGLLTEFLLKREIMLLKPVVIVEYEREPFVYEEGNVRITLDRNIKGSADFDHFFEKELLTRPVMDTGQHILEIKYDEFLPDFLRKQLNLGNLKRNSFSKYYLCRRLVK